MLYNLLIDPFTLGFIRRALAGCLALSLAAPPLGVFLTIRRMSLTADVLQHGILPGVAIGAIFGGLSIWWMGAGGLLKDVEARPLPRARATAQRRIAAIVLAAGASRHTGQARRSCNRTMSPR